MLHLPDKWVWDFWFTRDGADIHIFYLQADRSLGDPDLRHWQVSVGHAVSQNWRDWTILPDALYPSDSRNTAVEAFDSLTTWTGSILHHHNTWYLFYTGGKRSENGLQQRIGLATSDDLITWTKYSPNALLEPDLQWYETFETIDWHDQSWRDPWVFCDEKTGLFHMLITARSNQGAKFERGVIGHATSKNLINWQVQPPIATVSGIGVLEVPQLLHLNNQYYLIFSAYQETIHENYSQQAGGILQTGVAYLTSDHMLHGYTLPTHQFFAGGQNKSLYSGKIITDIDGSLALMAFHNFDIQGNFVGTIGNPIPLSLNASGEIERIE